MGLMHGHMTYQCQKHIFGDSLRRQTQRDERAPAKSHSEMQMDLGQDLSLTIMLSTEPPTLCRESSLSLGDSAEIHTCLVGRLLGEPCLGLRSAWELQLLGLSPQCLGGWVLRFRRSYPSPHGLKRFM